MSVSFYFSNMVNSVNVRLNVAIMTFNRIIENNFSPKRLWKLYVTNVTHMVIGK